MYGMLLPMNRLKAKIDFMRFVEAVTNETKIDDAIVRTEVKGTKNISYYSELKLFHELYPVVRDPSTCLNWYTKASFFHKVLNKSLRMLDHPKYLAFLRLPFSDLFLSIKEIYQKQKEKLFEKKESFTCYRGCSFRKEEIS